MKSFKTTLLLVLTIISSQAQVSWKIDQQHGHMGYSIKYMNLADYEGGFRSYAGKVNSKSETDFTDAVFNFRIDINSVSAEDEGHEGMLKDKKFFDIANYPTATFMSTSMKPTTVKNTFELEGNLTIKGITKKVKFIAVGADKPIINPYFNTVNYGFRLSSTIKRSDYGLIGLDMMEPNGNVLADDVNIFCSLILDKADYQIAMISNKTTADPKKLADYVGVYASDQNNFLVISSDQGKLFSKETGGINEEIFPINDSRFFYGFHNIEIEFIKDANGKITGYSKKYGKRESKTITIVNTDTLKGPDFLFNGIGWAFLENKNINEAISILKKGMIQHPKSLMIEGNLAHSYLFKNDYASAIKIYKSHLNETIAENYSWSDMIKQDFVFFKNHQFEKNLMDKVITDLKLDMPEEYKTN